MQEKFFEKFLGLLLPNEQTISSTEGDRINLVNKFPLTPVHSWVWIAIAVTLVNKLGGTSCELTAKTDSVLLNLANFYVCVSGYY